MSADKYVGGKQASQILGVHQRTLHNWDANGKIETIRTEGGKRMYNVDKYIRTHKTKMVDDPDCVNDLDELDKVKTKLNIAYVRVSSYGQRDDLERQKEMVQDLYPNHLIVKDIGSGINLNRRGLRKIIRLAIMGRINEVVIAYKDRLARFGFELIEDIIKEYSNGVITIINSTDVVEPEEELASDVLQIMNVFVARMNGMRKYNKSKKKTKKQIKQIKKTIKTNK